MEMKNNAVGWFELPVLDMDRAIKFYEDVFGFEMNRQKMGDLDMAWFPWIETGFGTTGSLVYQPDNYMPSQNSLLIYFTAHSGDLNNELSKVEPAGGKVLMPKTLITEEIGYMAVLLDSEGNRIAMHTNK